MKRYFITIIMLLPLLAGCKKDKTPRVEPAGGDRMAFSASFALAKSHFNGDGPQLYWDDTDRMAVYLSPVEDVFFTDNHYFVNVSEAMPISEIAADGITASFVSEVDREDWFAEPTEELPSDYAAYAGYYQYFAYYPSAATPASVLELAITDGEETDYYQYLPFNIPETQDGESYSDYQILFDPGLAEDEDVDMTSYLVSKDDVLGGANIQISNLKPATTMIRFSLQLAEGVDPMTVNSCVVSIIDEDDEISIAGDAQLRLFQYGDQESIPIAFDKDAYEEYLHPAESGHNAITITPASPLALSATPTDYLYAVLIPFKTESQYVLAKFSVQDSEGNYYVSRLRLPSWIKEQNLSSTSYYYGLREGYRYKAAVTLQPVEMDPETGNAGQYADGMLDEDGHPFNPFEELL